MWFGRAQIGSRLAGTDPRRPTVKAERHFDLPLAGDDLFVVSDGEGGVEAFKSDHQG